MGASAGSGGRNGTYVVVDVVAVVVVVAMAEGCEPPAREIDGGRIGDEVASPDNWRLARRMARMRSSGESNERSAAVTGVGGSVTVAVGGGDRGAWLAR